MDESESGQRVLEKVKWAYFEIYDQKFFPVLVFVIYCAKFLKTHPAKSSVNIFGKGGLVREGWKAVDLAFPMVKRQHVFFPSCKASEFFGIHPELYFPLY